MFGELSLENKIVLKFYFHFVLWNQKNSYYFLHYKNLRTIKSVSLFKMEQVVGIEPTSSAWKAEVLPLNYTCVFVRRFGAGSGNRTHVISLEGWGSTIELHLHFSWQKRLYGISLNLSSVFLYFFIFLVLCWALLFFLFFYVLLLYCFCYLQKHTRLNIAIFAKTFNANW